MNLYFKWALNEQDGSFPKTLQVNQSWYNLYVVKNNEFYCCSFSEKKRERKKGKKNQIGLIKSRMINFELKNYNINQFKGEKL